jgi:hypothetical protein
MNPRLLFSCSCALLLMGGTYAALHRIRGGQDLGRPAVRVVEVPLLGVSNRVIAATSVYLPERVPGFRSQAGEVSEWEVKTLPPDTQFGRRVYEAESGPFHTTASAVLMGRDRTSLHRPELCLPGQGWSIQRKQTTHLPLTDGLWPTLEVRRFDLLLTLKAADGSEQLRGGVYAFWFVADGEQTSSHWTRNLWMMRDMLTKNRLQRWAYVAYFSDCPPGEEEATFARMQPVITAGASEMLIRPDSVGR